MPIAIHPEALILGDLTIDFAKREVVRSGGRFSLTEREYQVLLYLHANLDRVVTREALERDVWQYASGIKSHAVAVAMRRLRAKMEEDPKNPVYLLTVFGTGFRLCRAGGNPEEPETSQPEQVHAPHLRQPVDAFFGRTSEQQQLAALLEQNTRLVTITGPGGMGKTRLAFQIAHHPSITARFGRRIFFCELVNAENLNEAFNVVAQVLDAPPLSRDVVSHITRVFHGMARALVILDNCEQIAGSLAEPLEQVLKATGDVQLLLTSRTRLEIAGEQVVPLGSLGEEEHTESRTHAAAVDLFIARAQQHGKSIARNKENLKLVENIARQVDGIPLAIELAAARIPLMPLPQLAERLKQSMNVLQARRPDRHGRHRTLQGVFDDTWRMLSDTEKSVILQLGTFRGGFTLQDAEQVALLDDRSNTPSVIDVVQTLVERGLLRPSNIENQHIATRFILLNTMAEYARIKGNPSALNDIATTAIQDAPLRHLKVMAARGSDEALRSLAVHRGVLRQTALSAEFENLCAAVRFGVANQHVREVVGAFRALVEVLLHRGSVHIGLELASQVYDMPGHEISARVAVLYDWGRLHLFVGQRSEAMKLLQNALQDAETSPECTPICGHILGEIGKIHRANGNAAAANTAYQHGIRYCLEQRDRIGEGILRGKLAALYLSRDRLSEAREFCFIALALFREVGNSQGVAGIHANLAGVYRAQGNLDAAIRAYEQAERLNLQLGNRREAAIGQANLAVVYRKKGDTEKAHALYAQALNTLREIGDRVTSAQVAGNLAIMIAESGAFKKAKIQLESALQEHLALKNTFSAAIMEGHIGMVCIQTEKFEEGAFHLKRAVDQLQQLDRQGAAGSFMSALAMCYANTGEHSQADECLQDAQRLLHDSGMVYEQVKGRLHAVEIAILRKQREKAETIWLQCQHLARQSGIEENPEVASALNASKEKFAALP
jgi:predicted ATPase/Tfp pilus assembly protein PilF